MTDEEAALDWLRNYHGSIDSTALLLAYRAGARRARSEALEERERKMKGIKLVTHDTPESIVTRHFNFEEDPAFTLADIGSLGGEDEEGNEVEYTVEQMLEGMRETRFWGFSIKPKAEVHIWAAPDAPRERLMMLLGHEIGHLQGEQLDGTVEEEMRADTYGEVAALAYTMLEQVTN